MSFKKLQEFIEMAKAAGASELSYKDGDKEFSIGFPTSEQKISAMQDLAPANRTQATSAPALATKADSSLIDITSPFVGTFYESAAPGAAPFIKVGDRVSEGKVLCIIEAMKIMNEIEAELSGEIVEICVQNENYVEYGEVLFRVRKV